MIGISGPETDQALRCYHCGEECDDNTIRIDSKHFCCQGCKTVYEILTESGLTQYYQLEKTPGTTQKKRPQNTNFDFLDNPEIQQKLLSFSSDSFQNLYLKLPAIHCSSCIWLLENLKLLEEGILDVKVNFSKKEALVSYNPQLLSLKELAVLLDMIGYPPEIKWQNDTNGKGKRAGDSLAIKVGVAGFCFGNIMLLSFPEYLGFTGEFSRELKYVFSYLSLLLSLPVVFYCSRDYYTSAYKSLKSGFVNIDVPITLGITVLFLRSAYEIVFDTGLGYMDSLAGLLFFLLIGKWLQAKTYEGLSFERDYKSYFPVSVTKIKDGKSGHATLKEIEAGDRLYIRNHEIIPADARLLSEEALLDYSFVNGEATPVAGKKGDYIFAGGREVGKGIEVEVIKKVSQSYLTQLWNNEIFKKTKENFKSLLINRISQYFTITVLIIALAAAASWFFIDASQAWLVFTAVLIVACPCALVLSSPFTNGNAMQVFGRMSFYLKNSEVVEKLNQIDTIVFDKTGTITHSDHHEVEYVGEELTPQQQAWIKRVVGNSTHPLSQAVHAGLSSAQDDVELDQYTEVPGKGVLAKVAGHAIRIGSADFIGSDAVASNQTVSRVYVMIDDVYLGYFNVETSYRKGLRALFKKLKDHYSLLLLSGDNARDLETVAANYISRDKIHFNQSPQDKLDFIRELQRDGKKVMMIGDGLNDAGALRQSDIGIAVTDHVSNFTPASDAILLGSNLRKLDKFMAFGRYANKIVIASFILSFLYNLAGISLAVLGYLEPIVAAILMPLSSISVVLFATLTIQLTAKKRKMYSP
ncbi:heavy metal translocating P-type ATPase metal-binding domain-containing protein [Fulvivirgaceae bacterium BMA12]|uniref:Heavy metal translocating P-type ATPase metal-binding domain-containing protein n=1 Tax=Agaribacillus aureus TaxID=3051825 RepID=A0ABT8L812_9BACT|nr:heavy metal translocating P-type ATPase metal-binding domain-containing protein [Fulvivirgaceae bacterium BMA12]